MLTLIVRVFKQMRAWFALLSFESWEICFLVHFTTPCKLVMMFGLVGTIALDVFCVVDSKP